MVQDNRASESPVAHLKGLNVKTDRRHDRRPLEVDEVRRLLEATRACRKRYGMTGPERAMVYRLAVETGLRANELRTLKNHPLILTVAQSQYRQATANTDGKMYSRSGQTQQQS